MTKRETRIQKPFIESLQDHCIFHRWNHTNGNPFISSCLFDNPFYHLSIGSYLYVINQRCTSLATEVVEWRSSPWHPLLKQSRNIRFQLSFTLSFAINDVSFRLDDINVIESESINFQKRKSNEWTACRTWVEHQIWDKWVKCVFCWMNWVSLL